MSKCLKCGAQLPPVGECPACAAHAARQPAAPAVPSLLDRDLQIDRRRSPDRADDVPAFADLGAQRPPPPPPSVAPLAGPLPPPATPRAAPPMHQPGVARPTPPGMTPAAPRAAPAAPVAQPRAAQPAPVAPPRPQAPVAQPRAFAADIPPAPEAQPSFSPMTPAYGTPSAPPPRAPSMQPLPGVAAPAPLPRMEEPDTLKDPVFAPEPQAPVAAPASLPAPGLPRMEEAAPRVEKSRPPQPARPATPEVTEVHARPASLWRRLLSFGIDAAAIAGVAALYITLASSVTGLKAPEAGLSGLDGFVAWLRALHSVLLPGFFLVLILALVYCAVAAFLWNGRTLGRLLLGLRLVDTHGLAPAPGRAIIRAMLSSVSFVLFLGGFWMALFDRRGQTLHDKLTSTFVVQPS
ncbi:RDD family protein [Myxococcus stipitatus]|uniref:RDD family protein n=1 Tax=Myxococcus stipitatus TaxID=83455 RepID=UPI001F36138F|nr:RDD family protein [Myxococcus stipitatus]MCE9669238.1 RDD family protein [Myxococcus stipitatus]